MRRRICVIGAAACLVSCFLLIAIAGSNEGSYVELEEAQPLRQKTDNTLFLAVLGDTGGIPVMHETRAQRKVASSLAELSATKGLDAVIGVGDNIYFTGAIDEFDSRFESSFENPYQSKWLDVPWYMIAGNHDHYGNITAQIAYSRRSRKWRYPSLYYNISLKTPDNSATVDVIFLDTIMFCGKSRDIEYSGFWGMVFSRSHELEGPLNATIAAEQWAWLEEKLSSSRAKYLFVVGHYPIYSISSHGPTKCLIEKLLPLLYKYNVSAYLSGHDHGLQHIQSTNGNRKMDLIISGAASRADPSTKHLKEVETASTVSYWYPKKGTIINQLGISDGGFTYLEISSSSAKVDFLDSKGRPLYTTRLNPRD